MTDTRRKHDYIPRNAEHFASFLGTAFDYIDSKKTIWTHIPNAMLNYNKELYEQFLEALHTAKGQHTTAQILDRNQKRAKVEKSFRELTNQYLRYQPVTDVDRAEMGINNHDTIRTDHKEVLEQVSIEIGSDGIRTLLVNFKIKDADHKAKPAGYAGVVIFWEILDEPPTNTNQLTHHAFASRTPYRIIFEEAERGKAVYITMAWQNARGIHGRWSEIQKAFVP